jgi:hypothetical protein
MNTRICKARFFIEAKRGPTAAETPAAQMMQMRKDNDVLYFFPPSEACPDEHLPDTMQIYQILIF